MQHWQTEFEQHPFQTTWKALLTEVLHLTADDRTVKTTVQALVRLKKVVNYLQTIMSSTDVELIPKSLWDSFNFQSYSCLKEVKKYVSNGDVVHLEASNTHLDKFLSYLKPYSTRAHTITQVPVSTAHPNGIQAEEEFADLSQQIKNNSLLFYFSIAMMSVVMIITSIESLSVWPLTLKFAKYEDNVAMLIGMLIKLPFIIPFILLAIFASSRSNEYVRLEQDNANKDMSAKLDPSHTLC